MVICRDKSKFNIDAARKKINGSLDRNFYWSKREWPYKDIKPRIIVEEYLENDPKEGLHDYKVWCFNGQPQYIQYITGRLSKKTYEVFYDCNWIRQSFHYHNPCYQGEAAEPVNLPEMLSAARKLAADISFLRVDFYVLPDDSLRVGEMTFYPITGMGIWHPKEMDLAMGEKVTLPHERGE